MNRLTATRLLMCATLGLAALACGPAQAQNILERILGNPNVQALLGQRPAAITQEAVLCANSSFKVANPVRCQWVADTIRVQNIPTELRAVMSNPGSAAALRQLCVNVPVAVVNTNYLCVELGKGDATLGAEVAQRTTEEQNKAIMQAAGDQRP